MSWLIEAVKSILTLIGNVIGGLVTFLGQDLPRLVQFLLYAISTLPPTVTVFATAAITISVFYVVIGR